MTASATLSASTRPGAATLRAAGEWIVPTAAELDRRLRSLDLPSGQHVTFDLSGVERLDTAEARPGSPPPRRAAARCDHGPVGHLPPHLLRRWTLFSAP